MSLDLVIGPMFSGKSSYLLSSIRRYKEIGWSTYIITSNLDKRYSSDIKIVNHYQESCNADVAVDTLYTVSTHEKFLTARVVIIEEAQFYPDLINFVLEAVEVYEKHVIVAGLDGDASRKPFGSLLQLIPIADNVVKLKALCKKCGDGTDALFTSYKLLTIHNEDSNISVGGAEKYEALCRKHYLAYN